MSVFFFVAVARLNVVQIMHRGLICFFRLSMFSLPRLICIYGGTKARLVWCSSLKCKLERDNLREQNQSNPHGQSEQWLTSQIANENPKQEQADSKRTE